MSNIEPNQRRFIDGIARLFVPWGVPQTAATLYGYLLLCPQAVDLDEIARDLEISKSSASVAARLLEQYTLVHRLRVRGSKRILYEVSENYQEMLSQQSRLLEALASQLQAGVAMSGPKKIKQRLKDMAAFHLAARDAMAALLGKGRG